MAWFKRKRTRSGTWTFSTAPKITFSRGKNNGRQRSTRSFSTRGGFSRTTTLRIGGWTMRRRRKGFFDPGGWLASAACNAVDSAISRNYSKPMKESDHTNEPPVIRSAIIEQKEPNPVSKEVSVSTKIVAFFLITLFCSILGAASPTMGALAWLGGMYLILSS